MRVSWSAKRSNQSILNIHGRNYAEAEAPIFGHLMQRANSLEKILMLGKNEGQMRKGQQRISGLYSITDSLGRGDFPDSSVGKEFSCNARDSSLITESGRSTGEGIGYPLQHSWASLAAQTIKNMPTMWETWVQSLG